MGGRDRTLLSDSPFGCICRRKLETPAVPSIAIIGASADRLKFGNKAVRAYQQRGCIVYPTHPAAAEIEGLADYKTFRFMASA